jgi:hypothetical protein
MKKIRKEKRIAQREGFDAAKSLRDSAHFEPQYNCGGSKTKVRIPSIISVFYSMIKK